MTSYPRQPFVSRPGQPTQYFDKVTEMTVDTTNQLHLALLTGSIFDIKQILIRTKGSLNIKGPNDHTPLHSILLNLTIDATTKYNLVKQLIELRAPVDIPSTSGVRPLHLACEQQNMNIVSLLLDKKADINSLDTNNNTSLFYAVKPSTHACKNEVNKLIPQKPRHVKLQTDDLFISIFKQFNENQSMTRYRELIHSVFKTLYVNASRNPKYLDKIKTIYENKLLDRIGFEEYKLKILNDVRIEFTRDMTRDMEPVLKKIVFDERTKYQTMAHDKYEEDYKKFKNKMVAELKKINVDEIKQSLNKLEKYIIDIFVIYNVKIFNDICGLGVVDAKTTVQVDDSDTTRQHNETKSDIKSDDEPIKYIIQLVKDKSKSRIAFLHKIYRLLLDDYLKLVECVTQIKKKLAEQIETYQHSDIIILFGNMQLYLCRLVFELKSINQCILEMNDFIYVSFRKLQHVEYDELKNKVINPKSRDTDYQSCDKYFKSKKENDRYKMVLYLDTEVKEDGKKPYYPPIDGCYFYIYGTRSVERILNDVAEKQNDTVSPLVVAIYNTIIITQQKLNDMIRLYNAHNNFDHILRFIESHAGSDDIQIQRPMQIEPIPRVELFPESFESFDKMFDGVESDKNEQHENKSSHVDAKHGNPGLCIDAKNEKAVVSPTVSDDIKIVQKYIYKYGYKILIPVLIVCQENKSEDECCLIINNIITDDLPIYQKHRICASPVPTKYKPIINIADLLGNVQNHAENPKLFTKTIQDQILFIKIKMINEFLNIKFENDHVDSIKHNFGDMQVNADIIIQAITSRMIDDIVIEMIKKIIERSGSYYLDHLNDDLSNNDDPDSSSSDVEQQLELAESKNREVLKGIDEKIKVVNDEIQNLRNQCITIQIEIDKKTSDIKKKISALYSVIDDGVTNCRKSIDRLFVDTTVYDIENCIQLTHLNVTVRYESIDNLHTNIKTLKLKLYKIKISIDGNKEIEEFNKQKDDANKTNDENKKNILRDQCIKEKKSAKDMLDKRKQLSQNIELFDEQPTHTPNTNPQVTKDVEPYINKCVDQHEKYQTITKLLYAKLPKSETTVYNPDNYTDDVCYNMNDKLIPYLLKRGADPNLTNKTGETVLLSSGMLQNDHAIRSLLSDKQPH